MANSKYDVTLIQKLWKGGETAKEIAKVVGCHPNTVKYICRDLPKYESRKPPPSTAPQPETENIKNCIRLIDERLKKISNRLSIGGLLPWEISQEQEALRLLSNQRERLYKLIRPNNK